MAQKKPIAAAIFSMVISRRSAAARAVCRGVLGVNYYCRDAGEREGQPGEQEKLFFMMSSSRFGRAAAWPPLAGQAHPRNRSEKPKKINNRVI
jgi:hypothetical protein